MILNNSIVNTFVITSKRVLTKSVSIKESEIMISTAYLKPFVLKETLPLITVLYILSTKICYKKAMIIDFKILKLKGVIKLAERYASVKISIPLILFSFKI